MTQEPQAIFLAARRTDQHVYASGCNEDYGWGGEHAAYLVIYECPDCRAKNVVEQCAAWPITVGDCVYCYARVSWEIPSKAVKEVLR